MTAPPPLVRAALLLAVEGVALVALGAVYAVVSAVGRPENRLAAELAAAVAVLAGLGGLQLARGTRRARPWSRSPALVLQVLALPVGYGLIQGQLYYAGLPVLALALATLYQFATPEARVAYREAEQTSE